MNILPRINICGGLTVLCFEIANFLNPPNVMSNFKIAVQETMTGLNTQCDKKKGEKYDPNTPKKK
jgi:hypothetical protein